MVISPIWLPITSLFCAVPGWVAAMLDTNSTMGVNGDVVYRAVLAGDEQCRAFWA
jgi:hypothetical protein